MASSVAANNAAAAGVHELAEDGLEDVVELAEVLRAVAVAAILESGLAEAIVGRALLRILEAVIGLADRLELGLVVLAAAVAVGMVFLGHAPVRGLDRRVVRPALNPQQFVIVLLDHLRTHPHSRSG